MLVARIICKDQASLIKDRFIPVLQTSPIYRQHRDVNSLAIYQQYITPIFSRFDRNICRLFLIYSDICQFYRDICRFFRIYSNFLNFCIFKYFCIFYFADILPMFADIFVDKSDNFFLDPRRYIRRHDICNIDLGTIVVWGWELHQLQQ